MFDTFAMTIIARIESDYDEKFGIPRQAGLADGEARIVFEKEFRDPAAVRGLEGFSHLWILWQFSENLPRPGAPASQSALASESAPASRWSPTVRPPRLGGNVHMGVFATRSPFRPNPIGLSCVRIQQVEPETEHGPVITVRGADLMNGTPIYDIKPYIPYADCHPDATGGFADKAGSRHLRLDFPRKLLERLPAEKRVPLMEALCQDPRPGYQSDPERVYGMGFAGFNIRFRVEGDLLTVIAVESPAPADEMGPVAEGEDI